MELAEEVIAANRPPLEVGAAQAGGSGVVDIDKAAAKVEEVQE